MGAGASATNDWKSACEKASYEDLRATLAEVPAELREKLAQAGVSGVGAYDLPLLWLHHALPPSEAARTLLLAPDTLVLVDVAELYAARLPAGKACAVVYDAEPRRAAVPRHAKAAAQRRSNACRRAYAVLLHAEHADFLGAVEHAVRRQQFLEVEAVHDVVRGDEEAPARRAEAHGQQATNLALELAAWDTARLRSEPER